jgi:hypothetical protein
MRRESEVFTESKDPECASSGIAAARYSHSALLKALRECLASSVVRPASLGSFDALPSLCARNFADDIG